jgi:hypothetical protein
MGFFPAPAVMFFACLGIIGDFAYLYFKVARIRNIVTAGEAAAGVIIWLMALFLIVALAGAFIAT